MKNVNLPVALVILGVLACLSAATQVSTVSKTFPAGETGSLFVNIRAGDILVETGKSQVEIRVSGIEESDQKYLELRQEGINIYVNFNPENGYSDARFQIGVPRGFNLDLNTAGGDVKISGRLSGNLQGKTSGGDVSMEDVEGEVKVVTAGGDIRAGAVENSAHFTTAGGDITVTRVGGAVEAKTAGGDIEIGDVGSRLSATTAGGDIKLGSVGGEASAKTAGGDLIVGEVAGSATLKTAGGDVKLSAASGHVEAKTAGGDLNLQNVSGSIEGNTAGGDIIAGLIPSGEGPSALTTSGGDITLSLPSSASFSISATIHVGGRWANNQDEFEISSDFGPVEVVKDPARAEIRAQITMGGGANSITLSTNNGDISIKRM